MQAWTTGGWTITRVADPGFELVLPQDEATRATLRRSPWLQPHYATDDCDLRVGSSTLVVTGPGPTVVVDPFLAFDDPARTGERLAAVGAVVDPGSVDIVLNTHIDGSGTNVGADGAPAFPAARYLLPGPDLADTRAGMHPTWEPILEQADPATPGVLAPGLTVVDLPGHGPGHVGLRAGDALIIGHLFLHPAQVANPAVVQGDPDPAALIRTREAVLADAARDGTVIIGPLWAAPGGGRVARVEDRWALA